MADDQGAKAKGFSLPAGLIALLQALLIGLCAGAAAIAVKQGVGLIGQWRLLAAGSLPFHLGLPLVGLVGGLVAGLMVERVAPESSGSGIPQVKSLLSGQAIALDMRVAATKFVGGTIALGSGLMLGREGPTVQVGAALAARLTGWLPASGKPGLDLIAAGAGAGLAAAFNAPIAGVLFVAEELLKDVSMPRIGYAILACFTAATVAQSGRAAIFEVGTTPSLSAGAFMAGAIPFYIVLGGLAGALAALFNEGVLASLTLNFRRLRIPLAWRVAIAGLLTGLFMDCLPPAFHNYAELRHLIVGADLPGSAVATAFAVQFLLTLVAYGTGAPGGLFAPTLMLGASLGYLVGLVCQAATGQASPGAFAVAGMGAFFAGAIRAPLTAIVIIFEMTGDFALVLPLMISAATAAFVGERLSPGPLYDRLVAWGRQPAAPQAGCGDRST